MSDYKFISASDPQLAVDSSASSPAPTPLLQSVAQAIIWFPLLLSAMVIHLICKRTTQRALLAVALLDIPLQWGIHLDFRPSLSALGSIGGYDVSITTIAIVGLYVGWLLGSQVSHQRLRARWSWPIAVYTAIVAISVVTASDTQLAWFYVFILAQLLLLYLYISGNIQSPSDIYFILNLILIGGLFESVYMIALGLIGKHLGLAPVAGAHPAMFSFFGLKTVIFLPVKDVPFSRQGGTIGSPNYAAGYLGIIITLALCVRWMQVPEYIRRLAIPTICTASIALALTFSRGGWIEIMLSIAIVLGARWRRNGASFSALFAALLAVVILVLTLYTSNPISSRLFSNDNGSAESRIPLMHLAYNMIADKPVLGVGANNFAAVMTGYAGPQFRHAWIYTVHNQFLLVAAETGIVGLAAYLWIYLNLIRRAWRLWDSRDDLFAPLGLAIVAGTCGLMSHMLVDIFSERALLQIFWVFIAVVGTCEALGCGVPEMAPSAADVEAVHS